MTSRAPRSGDRSAGTPRRALGLLVATAIVLVAHGLPSAALACAVCGGGVERSRMAFFGTTILLSLLPLALFAGGLGWIARHARERLQGEFEERDSLPAPARSAEPAAASPGTDALLATPGAGSEG